MSEPFCHFPENLNDQGRQRVQIFDGLHRSGQSFPPARVEILKDFKRVAAQTETSGNHARILMNNVNAMLKAKLIAAASSEGPAAAVTLRRGGDECNLPALYPILDLTLSCKYLQ